jgi:hypothetical protein
MEQTNEFVKELGQGISIRCHITVPFGNDIDQETRDGFIEDIFLAETKQQNGINGWFLNNSWVTKEKTRSYKGLVQK